MIRGRIAIVFLLVWGLVALGSVSAQQRDASRAGGSVMRVVEPNTRSPAARIASRNAGVEMLRWDTRNGNPNGLSL